MKYICPMLTPNNGLPCKHYIRSNNTEEPGFCTQPSKFRCTEAMKKKLPSISYSRMVDFISCKEKYRLRVLKGIEARPHHLPEPLKLGRAWDAITHYLYDSDYNYNQDIEPLQLNDMQQARISALDRASQDLEIIEQTDGLIGCQHKVHIPVGQTQIIGYVDLAYEDHFIEIKLSSRPDFYTRKENVVYQLCTYFMANEQWDYADVLITRIPGLKTGWGKYSEESPQEYEKRIYGDVISRPAYYFIGWDRKTRTYGVRFWRSEFDLDEIFSTYVYVLEELQDTLKRNSWYPNNLACHVPAACAYLPIKRTGVVSEEIYKRKEVIEK
jgi:hypothetical protein